MRWIAFTLTLLTLLGCSGGIHLRRLDLEVLRAEQSLEFDGAGRAAEDRRWVLLSVSLRNTSRWEDFPVQFSGFTLRTGSGLEVAAASGSAALPEACPADLRLGKGAEVSCAIVFEVPMNEEPEAVTFESPEGRKDTAKVSLAPCTWCGDDCVDTLTDPENCGECGVRADDNQACVSGALSCLESDDTLCGEDCVDLSTSTSHCGACEEPAPPGHGCVDGQPDCGSSQLTSCEDGCFNLREDDENCGACGQSCGRGTCVNGDACEDYTQVGRSETCDDACAEQGYTCDYGIAYYNSSCYPGYDEVALDCGELPASSSGSCWSYYATGCFCELVFR